MSRVTRGTAGPHLRPAGRSTNDRRSTRCSAATARTGMEQVYNPRTMAEQSAACEASAPLDAASPDCPKVRQIYQNVQVLGNLSVAQFNRLMVSMTSWVAPEQGCVLTAITRPTLPQTIQALHQGGGAAHGRQMTQHDQQPTGSPTSPRHGRHLLHLPPR